MVIKKTIKKWATKQTRNKARPQCKDVDDDWMDWIATRLAHRLATRLADIQCKDVDGALDDPMDVEVVAIG